MTCLVAWVLHFFLFYFFHLRIREIGDHEVEHMCEEERFFRRLMQENNRDGYGGRSTTYVGNVWEGSRQGIPR